MPRATITDTITANEDNVNTEITMPNAEELLMNEDAILRGMLDAANFRESEEMRRKIQIKRGGGPVLFEFRIRPLSEEELIACRKGATKTIVNPAGRHLPRIDGDTDLSMMRSLKIITATVDDDKPKTWENPVLKNKLNVLHSADVVDAVLMGGEKDWICDIIDEISGYGAQRIETEEYTKN